MGRHRDRILFGYYGHRGISGRHIGDLSIRSSLRKVQLPLNITGSYGLLMRVLVRTRFNRGAPGPVRAVLQHRDRLAAVTPICLDRIKQLRGYPGCWAIARCQCLQVVTVFSDLIDSRLRHARRSPRRDTLQATGTPLGCLKCPRISSPGLHGWLVLIRHLPDKLVKGHRLIGSESLQQFVCVVRDANIC